VPSQYGAAIRHLKTHVRGIEKAAISVHCHNDLGLAVANSLTAVMEGARQIECTINGIGERAGNCSLEEVVMIMKTRPDMYPYRTGIHTEHLFSASELLGSTITFGPQPNKAIVGRNAFAHEAGIHQDGYLKEKSTYEIIDPRSVGVPEGKLVLGKHSGRHALNQRCKDMGFDLSKEELDGLYHRFTAVADHRKKGLMDEEIVALIHEGKRVLRVAAD
jgi:2-isopropylmalate synthase